MTTTAPRLTRGLTIEVLRRADGIDCTNNGISARHDSLFLVGVIDRRNDHKNPRLPAWRVEPLAARIGAGTDPTGQRPHVALDVSWLDGHVLRIVPVQYNDDPIVGDGAPMAPPMASQAGGNYGTGDARLGSLIRDLTGTGFYGALSIHDRIERN